MGRLVYVHRARVGGIGAIVALAVFAPVVHAQTTQTAGHARIAQAASRATPQVPDEVAVPVKGTLTRRPSEIVYSGDGSGFIAGSVGTTAKPAPITWGRWTRQSANGEGSNWIDNCKPDCATGHFAHYLMTVRLSRGKRLGGHLVFTQMTWEYIGRPPPRQHHVETLRLEYRRSGGGEFLWGE
jgi:hypothetical protein